MFKVLFRGRSLGATGRISGCRANATDLHARVAGFIVDMSALNTPMAGNVEDLCLEVRTTLFSVVTPRKSGLRLLRTLPGRSLGHYVM